MKTVSLAIAIGICIAGSMASAEELLSVAADGSGKFTTVQAAVDAVPMNNSQRVIIEIKPGTYKEHIVVPKEKPLITFRGQDAATTILTDDKNVNATDAAGVKLKTPDSSSTWIRANDFSAENITFENTAGNHGQAMALYFDADRGAFRNCRFLGWQDTLRVNFGRSYFADCQITGHVDFIYGKGVAVFERCEIRSVSDGYITAAATPQGAPFGYVFMDCRLTAEAAAKRVYLGRPWRDFAAVAFIRCEMGEHIRPEGWHNWNKPNAEQTARYAEYGCTGPGADRSKRVNWSKELTDEEAGGYTIHNILGGNYEWSPLK